MSNLSDGIFIHDKLRGWKWRSEEDIYHDHPGLELLWDDIHRKLRIRNVTMEKLFKLMDKNTSKSVDCKEFRNGLERAGIKPLPPVWQLEDLFRNFDADGSGVVAYHELASRADPSVQPNHELAKKLEMKKLAELKLQKRAAMGRIDNPSRD